MGTGVAALLAAVVAFTPGNGGVLAPPRIAINEDPGAQVDPHVDGDLAAFSNAETSQIFYYDFPTANSGAIDNVVSGNTAIDLLSDVDQGRIVFTRILSNGTTSTSSIMLFDRSTTTVTELAATANSNRMGVGIGGNTVAFIDYSFSSDGTGEVMILDLTTSTLTRVTNDGATDWNPAVSNDGNTVAWEHCPVSPSNCDIWVARRTGSTWSAPSALTSGLVDEREPDVSGDSVVFQRGDNVSGFDIVVASLTGGPEQVVELPGLDLHPSIRGSLVAFERRTPTDTNSDIYLLDLSNKQVYQITNTPTSNETLNDVSVLGSGEVRLVWSATDDFTATSFDIYGSTFVLPPSGPPTGGGGGTGGGTGGGGGSVCTGTVTLEASRSYCPTRWTDGRANLSFPVTIPASLPVTSGGSGGKKATLTFETPSGRLVCWYRGVQASSYTFERCQLESRGGGSCGGGHGRNYGHGHRGGGGRDDDDDDDGDDDDDDHGHGHGGGSSNSSYVAGSTVTASAVVLHIQGGNHSSTTRVSVTLTEACGSSSHPLDAAGAPDAREGANVGCSSAGDALVPLLMFLAMALLLRRRPAQIRLVARQERRTLPR